MNAIYRYAMKVEKAVTKNKHKHRKAAGVFQKPIVPFKGSVAKVIIPKKTPTLDSFILAKEPKDELAITIPDHIMELYVKTVVLDKQSYNEMSGMGVITEDRVLDYMVVCTDAIRSSSNVDADWASAKTAALVAGERRFLNAHWHTHPGMGVFFSGTDDDHQEMMMKDMVAMHKSGSFYFIVLDQLDTLVYKYQWNEESRILFSGKLYWRSAGLELAKRPSIAYTPGEYKGYIAGTGTPAAIQQQYVDWWEGESQYLAKSSVVAPIEDEKETVATMSANGGLNALYDVLNIPRGEVRLLKESVDRYWGYADAWRDILLDNRMTQLMIEEFSWADLGE